MIKIEKSIKLKGTITVNGRTVKEFITDIDDEAVSTTTEYTLEKSLYNQNRKQMRKDEKAYLDKIRELEDEIIAKMKDDEDEKVEEKEEKEELE